MKILSYLLSPIFVIAFFLVLIVFQPIQWLAVNLFGANGHQRIVEIMNWFLIQTLLVLGVGVKVIGHKNLPQDATLLFVSNHQSMFDISPIIWHFKKHIPKFVSKKELAKGIPSISYNLRKGGAALIDRKDKKQAITEMVNFAKRVHTNKWSAVIFPEGTRSRDGKPKKFATNGLKILIKYNPEAYIVPLTINNSWKVFKYGKFPLGIGSPIKIITHEPIKAKSVPFEELIEQVEAKIVGSLEVTK